LKTPSAELTFALRLVDAAAEEILPRFPPESIGTKADGSEVTLADLRAEAAMRCLIGQAYPDHGVLGEERGAAGPQSGPCWILDPIDGTTWFSLGIPKFGTLVSLVVDRVPLLGVVHLPVTRETLFAEQGRGSWYSRGNGPAQRISVDHDTTCLADAFVSAAGVHATEVHAERDVRHFHLADIIHKAGKFRFVGDCVQHGLVARGMLHAAIDTITQPWDTAAIIPIVEEAGGFASTVDGRTDDVVFGGSLLTSSTPQLHAQILRKLNP
jgi:histidinol-phosphatase